MKTEAIRLCIQAQYGKEDYEEARKELNALLDRIQELEAAQQLRAADKCWSCGKPWSEHCTNRVGHEVCP